MDSRPPEFFNRGPTPLARLLFYVALAVVVMVVDLRLKYLDALRQSLTVLVHPLQQAALVPTRLAERVSAFFVSQYQLQSENSAIRQQLLAQAEQLQRFQSVAAEASTLRSLLGVRQRVAPNAILVEILHTGRNPFSRKVVVDKGAQDGVRAGQAVIDAVGIVGQVTQVYPFSSEITLLTEKNQAVPVMVLRNGLRAVLFGNGQDGAMDLPFVPVNADVQNGDTLVTSGIDGTYPAGLTVATVTNIERNAAYVFSKITCTPTAGVASNKYMLVLAGDPAESRIYTTSQPSAEKPLERKGKSDRGRNGMSRRGRE